MANKAKRDSYTTMLLEDTVEALTMNPIETSKKEIPEKPKRKLRVSISVAVTSANNEEAAGGEGKPGVPPDAGYTANCTPAKPARFVACCPLEDPFSGDMEDIGAAYAGGMLCGNGLSQPQNCPADCRYACAQGGDGILPCYPGCEDNDLQDCSLDRCSLAGETNSVDTFTDDWTDSVSNYVASRCFATRLVNCFCCLKPHDD